MDQGRMKQVITEFITKYKFVVLVFAVGILLMLLPQPEKEQTKPEVEPVTQTTDLTVEEKLSQILSCVKGAGKVTVMLTCASGQNTVYQTDTDRVQNEQNSTLRADTVTVTDANRNETGLIQRIDPPVYLGALIVCQGADDPSVKLAVVEAVSSVTGLTTDKICVLKMK